LIQMHKEVVPMVYNTGVCFFLAGLCLLYLALDDKYLRIVSLLSGFIFLINIIVLAQYIFNVDLHIDNLIVDPYNTTKQVYPGRMAPNTVLSFIAFSMGIFLLARPKLNKSSFILTYLLSYIV